MNLLKRISAICREARGVVAHVLGADYLAQFRSEAFG
jgi:hypothetical protein